MSYEYTDHYGTRFEVYRTGATKRVQLGVCSDGTWHMAYAAHEEAPALALAILEAAGVGENKINDQDVMTAWHALNAYQIQRAEDMAQEAEDAKVDAYRRAKVSLAADWTEWEHLTEAQKDLWREDYHVARKFFEKATR